MTTGHPASASRARWTRERLIGLGLGADQIILSECSLPPLRSESDLTPAQYRPEFAPVVQRVARLLGTGRGISVYVTGGRDAVAPRLHAALQIALGLAPLGRQVVLADSEFLRPGLEGLLAQPLAEGILDMVRFGRSSRALLQRPVPEGPWLLPAGSIPAEDPAPLDADALRSVVYRISQICDLALYVGPLPMRDEVHPMVRVCDHVLLASDESAVAPSEIVDALSALQAQHVHVLGAVLVAPIAAAVAIPAPYAAIPPAIPPLVAPLESARPGAPMETPPIPSFAPESRSTPIPPLELPATPKPLWAEGGLEPPRAWPPVAGTAIPGEFPPFEPTTVPPRAVPDPSPAALEPRVGLPPLAPEFETTPFSFREPATEPSFPSIADAPRAEEPFGARESYEGEPEPDSDLQRSEPSPLRNDTRAARRTTSLPDAEFAFDDTAKFSRWPLVVVIVLLATIVFFVGSIFVFRNRNANAPGSARNEAPLAGAKPDSPPNGATTGPDDSQASQGSEPLQPADRAAADAGGTKPLVTSSPATQPDDRSAAPTTPNTTAPANEIKPPVTVPQPAVRPPSSTTGAAPGPDRTTPTSPPATSTQPRDVGPPSSTPAEESPPAVAAEALYAVHVASYQTLRKANIEIASLKARGYEGRAIETDLGSKGTWYRVYAGSYPTAAEAARARAVLLQLPDYNFAQVRRLPRS